MRSSKYSKIFLLPLFFIVVLSSISNPGITVQDCSCNDASNYLHTTLKEYNHIKSFQKDELPLLTNLLQTSTNLYEQICGLTNEGRVLIQVRSKSTSELIQDFQTELLSTKTTTKPGKDVLANLLQVSSQLSKVSSNSKCMEIESNIDKTNHYIDSIDRVWMRNYLPEKIEKLQSFIQTCSSTNSTKPENSDLVYHDIGSASSFVELKSATKTQTKIGQVIQPLPPFIQSTSSDIQNQYNLKVQFSAQLQYQVAIHSKTMSDLLTQQKKPNITPAQNDLIQKQINAQQLAMNELSTRFQSEALIASYLNMIMNVELQVESLYNTANHLINMLYQVGLNHPQTLDILTGIYFNETALSAYVKGRIQLELKIAGVYSSMLQSLENVVQELELHIVSFSDQNVLNIMNNLLVSKYSSLADLKTQYQQELNLIAALQSFNQQIDDTAESYNNLIENLSGVRYQTDTNIEINLQITEDVQNVIETETYYIIESDPNFGTTDTQVIKAALPSFPDLQTASTIGECTIQLSPTEYQIIETIETIEYIIYETVEAYGNPTDVVQGPTDYPHTGDNYPHDNHYPTDTNYYPPVDVESQIVETVYYNGENEYGEAVEYIYEIIYEEIAGVESVEYYTVEGIEYFITYEPVESFETYYEIEVFIETLVEGATEGYYYETGESTIVGDVEVIIIDLTETTIDEDPVYTLPEIINVDNQETVAVWNPNVETETVVSIEYQIIVETIETPEGYYEVAILESQNPPTYNDYPTGGYTPIGNYPPDEVLESTPQGPTETIVYEYIPTEANSNEINVDIEVQVMYETIEYVEAIEVFEMLEMQETVETYDVINYVEGIEMVEVVEMVEGYEMVETVEMIEAYYEVIVIEAIETILDNGEVVTEYVYNTETSTPYYNPNTDPVLVGEPTDPYNIENMEQVIIIINNDIPDETYVEIVEAPYVESWEQNIEVFEMVEMVETIETIYIIEYEVVEGYENYVEYVLEGTPYIEPTETVEVQIETMIEVIVEILPIEIIETVEYEYMVTPEGAYGENVEVEYIYETVETIVEAVEVVMVQEPIYTPIDYSNNDNNPIIETNYPHTSDNGQNVEAGTPFNPFDNQDSNFPDIIPENLGGGDQPLTNPTNDPINWDTPIGNEPTIDYGNEGYEVPQTCVSKAIHTQSGHFSISGYHSCDASGLQSVQIAFDKPFETAPDVGLMVAGFELYPSDFNVFTNVTDISTESFTLTYGCNAPALELNWIATIAYYSGINIFKHRIQLAQNDPANNLNSNSLKFAIKDQTRLSIPGAFAALSGWSFYDGTAAPTLFVSADNVSPSGYDLSLSWGNQRLEYVDIIILHYEQDATTHKTIQIGAQGEALDDRYQNAHIFVDGLTGYLPNQGADDYSLIPALSMQDGMINVEYGNRQFSQASLEVFITDNVRGQVLPY